MASSYCSFVMLLFITAVLITAGYSLSINNGKPVKTISTVPTIMSILTPSTAHTIPIPPSEYWIRINPIGDEHHMREMFEINGTTNLDLNNNLQYSIDRRPVYVQVPGCPPPGDCDPRMMYDGSDNISYGEIPIIKGGPAGNSWSFVLNSSSPGYSKNDITTEFILKVTSSDTSVYNSTYFLLLSTTS